MASRITYRLSLTITEDGIELELPGNQKNKYTPESVPHLIAYLAKCCLKNDIDDLRKALHNVDEMTSHLVI